MDGINQIVKLEELRCFHDMDRRLYSILVWGFLRDPIECLQIMGLWFLLERRGFGYVIYKILSLPLGLINEVADEAAVCLKCIMSQIPLPDSAAEIPLTRILVKKEVSLQFFHEHRLTTLNDVQNLVSEVCIPAFSDLMRSHVRTLALCWSSANQIIRPSLGSMRSNAPMDEFERTMFLTFSKGYPVSENEVKLFFTGIFGECIESFHMQVVRLDEQALYARIVFLRPWFIKVILNGVNKAKFTINGKHVWMRTFGSRQVRLLPCWCTRCTATGTFFCLL